jgi:hypothetical protein
MAMKGLLFGVAAWDVSTLAFVAAVLSGGRWRRVFCRRDERLQ